jgi:hypothetical protein
MGRDYEKSIAAQEETVKDGSKSKISILAPEVLILVLRLKEIQMQVLEQVLMVSSDIVTRSQIEIGDDTLQEQACSYGQRYYGYYSVIYFFN